MGALRDKIIELVTSASSDSGHYQPYDVAYAATINWFSNPVLTSSPIAQNTINGTPPSLSAIGPVGESYSWLFPASTRIRHAAPQGASLINTYIDRDYSGGFWFMYPTLPTGTTATAGGMFGITGNQITGIYVTGSTFAGNPSRLNARIGTTTGNNIFGPTLQANTWYYIAFRRSSADNNYDFYLNGQYQATFTNSEGVANANIFFGSPLISSTQPFYMSNYYGSTYAQVDAADILAIWNSTIGGTSINYTNTSGATATALMVDPAISVNSNAILSETPATASAIFAEPTIIVSSPNFTEITTSIVASVLFPDATVQTTKFVNNVADLLLASADIINNVDVQASTSVSFGAQEMTASAEFVEAFQPITPMFATALMVNPTIFVNPNYRRLVKALNPSLYLNNPGGSIGGVPTAVNDGYENWETATVESGVRLRASAAPLDYNGNGFCYGINTGSSAGFKQWQFTSATAVTRSQYFNTNGASSSNDFTLEFWYYALSSNPGSIVRLGLTEVKILNNVLRLRMVGDEIAFDGYDPTFEHTQALDLTLNNWHHIVITVNHSNTDPYTISQIWHNGAYKSQRAARFVNFEFTEANEAVGVVFNDENGNLQLSDIALYKSVLSNSDIVEHYTFMTTNSPNVIYLPEPWEASAISGDHNFLVTSNENIAETPATATALIPMPSILAVRNLSTSATPLTASATNTDAEIYWGWTIVATPATASAFKAESYFLKNTYYNYVQANIAPYRYVSFDAADATLDYGTDNNYSVIPTVVGGTIVNPDLAINGKSAKTAGASYITDGVILKESEWNDSWGTGANDWHSAFWFQRALDDNSTTGLRVLWNLNGYKDNQHAVLYQYQGRLHMQFNNGSGTFIETDSTALDLFDYNRHFVVIDHNHGGGSTNTIKLYVDAVLRFTVNIGSITPTTTNAATADSGPNTELNNRPRLSVGCLITPFASTALPVVPTNTKLIIDEIYWDKNSISSTQVANLFNIMPDKDNSDYISSATTATAELVMPAFSTTVNFVATPLTASASFIQPLITADRQVISTANVMTATALFVEPRLFEDRTLVSDIFVASAIFNNPGVVISIPGQPMLATVRLATNIGFKHYDDDGDFINIIPLSDNLTPLVRYVRVDAINNRIPNLMEVK